MREPVSVFIIDPNPLARKLLSEMLSVRPEIRLLGAAATPSIAERYCVDLDPQVLVIDFETPVDPGLKALKTFAQNRAIAAVIYTSLKESDLSKVEAHSALEVRRVLKKPESGLAQGIARDTEQLIKSILALSSAALPPATKKQNVELGKKKTSHILSPPIEQNLPKARRIIAIGASTGGTQALQELLQDLPAYAPGIVVVQHMPADFTAAFARRLNESCKFAVKEARGGELVEPGVVLIAHGGMHLEVVGKPGNLRVALRDGPKVSGHRPSVDVLFNSVAKAAGAHAIGVLLTGMGQDGAEGLLEIRLAGGRTLAQDEHSSAVFGMPRAAYINKATEELIPISHMAERIMSLIN
jgi:two-component system, chemotaxis family, protein-glutamate methylesterase/glutaminase